MFNFKHKFIVSVIFITLFLLLSIFIYWYYKKNVDKNSYVFLVDWQARLNQNFLKVEDRKILHSWDVIKTIWNSSIAVLEWWDWSVTRLSWNATVNIDEAYVSGDLSKMNISFKLLSWKSWSNVISFFWDWSYFKEQFQTSEAAVRWTVFDLDLNNDYLYVVNHKIDLTNWSWEVLTINENEPYKLSDFSKIDLELFIKNIKDDVWESINDKYDKELLFALKQKLNENIKQLSKYKDINVTDYLWDEEKRIKMYNELLSDYQNLNIVSPDDWELFKLKLELKNKLIELADDKNKSLLVTSTLYDFKSLLESKIYNEVDLVLKMLSTNSKILSDIDMKKYFDGVSIPDDIKVKISENFWVLKDFFQKTFDWINGFRFDDIKNLHDKASDVIQQWLNSLIDKK